MNTIMNLRVSWRAGKFLTSCPTISVSKGALLHGVSWINIQAHIQRFVRHVFEATCLQYPLIYIYTHTDWLWLISIYVIKTFHNFLPTDEVGTKNFRRLLKPCSSGRNRKYRLRISKDFINESTWKKKYPENVSRDIWNFRQHGDMAHRIRWVQRMRDMKAT
jgi:hypothetical protein